RILNLLLILYLSVDYVYTIAVSTLIPTDSDDLLLYPDVGFLVLNTGRHYVTFAILCFKLNSLSFAIWCYFDHLKWYQRINNIYRTVATEKIHRRLINITKRCRILLIWL